WSGPVVAFGRQAQGPKLAVLDEGENFFDRRIVSHHRLHAFQPLGEDARTMKELLVEPAHGRQALLGELPPLHADEVEAFQYGILTVDQSERNHIAADATDAANHHLRPNPRELVHGGHSADVDKIADLAMAAERGRGREDHVVADKTIMADMAVVHVVAALADLGETTALHCADIHGDAFADRAIGADLKPCQLAPVAQILRRAAKHHHRRDHTAITDRGLTHHLHMRHQLAVPADDDAGADNAIGADRGSLTDDRAISNPRGGIDR